MKGSFLPANRISLPLMAPLGLDELKACGWGWGCFSVDKLGRVVFLSVGG